MKKKSLKEITDADALHIASIAGSPLNKPEDRIRSVKNLLDMRHDNRRIDLTGMEWYKLLAYLAAQGYDIQSTEVIDA